MASEHLIIIIDNNDKIEAKKYSCKISDKTKEDAISSAKKAYENKYSNFDYKSYYFIYFTN